MEFTEKELEQLVEAIEADPEDMIETAKHNTEEWYNHSKRKKIMIKMIKVLIQKEFL